MMNSSSKDSSGKRKGHGLFSKGGLLGTNGSETGDKKREKKLSKRSSIFNLGAQDDADRDEDEETLSPLDADRSNSTKTRPQNLQRNNRPSSVFGSFKKSGNTLPEDTEADIVPASPVDSEHEVPFSQFHRSGGRQVLLHGEVQTTTGLFRKKKEYLVLTDSHLIRFKSQTRAADTFPNSFPPSTGRVGATRHSSSASIGSAQDLQSLNSHASIEGDNAVPLRQIVAAYKVEDGKHLYTTDVVYLDEEHGALGSIQLMLNDPKEADLWHTSIRGAAQRARLLSSQPYPERVVSYLVRIVENAMDYDAENFQIYRVVRRPPSKGGKNSSDDLKVLSSNMSYMVIGINKLHLISLPDFGESSIKTMDGKSARQSFGLVTLVSMDVRYSDDTFELGFRQPLQAPVLLDLAAAAAPEIVSVIHRSILYLKPQWLDYTFLYGGPPEILDDTGCAIPTDEDNGWFDRTLVAYCMAYNSNPGRIRYAIDLNAEDAPEFQLLPPQGGMPYSVTELLSVFRALRFNETFHSISFNGVNLGALYGLVDTHGKDHVATAARSGLSLRKIMNINIDPTGKSLLYQEIQAIALKANHLRRLDLGNTLPKRRVRDTFDEDGRVDKDPGCEVAAAILPLCRIHATNVDWIVFNGIELGETDLEELVLSLNDNHNSRFRCIEVSRCGLSDRGMQLFLNSIEHQKSLQCLNISDNPGRLQLERFPITMSRFSGIRRLDLSRITCTSGPEPLIAPEVMLSWRLEELVLTGFPVNEMTLDAISTYLASEMSNNLYRLQMDQCNLTGAHVAILMRSMCRAAGQPRPLHLHVSANRLEKGNSEIVKAIEENFTPTHLTMRMVEYGTESRFRQLLQALRVNTTIRSLDISKASLPNDASEETCKALCALFEDNTTLEELDISGEHAHLEIARFGIGLSAALAGLRKNRALKVLKIEYQNLGLEGANTLSTVLEENITLEHIFCEHNEINLQGFTVLVNALANNFTVLYLPEMKDDQAESTKFMMASIAESRAVTVSKMEGKAKNSVRKTLNTIGVKGPKQNSVPTPQDIEQAVHILNARWEKQLERLADFIARNYRFLQGLETPEMYKEGGGEEHMRPHTAGSDSGIIDHVLSNTTPRIEFGDPIDAEMEMRRRLELMGLNGHAAEDNEKLPVPVRENNGVGESGQEAHLVADQPWISSSPDNYLAMHAALGRAFELGGQSSPSETEVSSLKS